MRTARLDCGHRSCPICDASGKCAHRLKLVCSSRRDASLLSTSHTHAKRKSDMSGSPSGSLIEQADAGLMATGGRPLKTGAKSAPVSDAPTLVKAGVEDKGRRPCTASAEQPISILIDVSAYCCGRRCSCLLWGAALPTYGYLLQLCATAHVHRR